MSVFNLDLLEILRKSPSLLLIKNTVHSLFDTQGNLISEFGSMNGEDVDQFVRTVDYDGAPILTLKGKTLAWPFSDVYALLECMLVQDIKLHERLNYYLARTEMEKTSRHQLNALFVDSHFQKNSLKYTLEMALSVLRCHVPIEVCSIFIVKSNGSKEVLKGEAGLIKGASIDFCNSKEWEIDESSIMGITALSRHYYVTNCAYEDSNYKTVSDYEVPANLACFPILHGHTLLGILNLKNNLNIIYETSAIKFIHRLLIVLGHIIYVQNQKNNLLKSELTKKELGFYVSHNVLENIELTGKVQKRGEGVRKKAVCLFCDIRSFTSISEKLDPKLLVKLLNIYFSELIPIVGRYDGTVDKLVGDMIAAFWNLPQDVSEPELKATKAAIEMQKIMIRKVVPMWNLAGVSRVGIGIGIHTGAVIAGNLGASQLMNYTAMGDTVFNAEKLESLARPGEILISEEMHKLVEGKVIRADKVIKGVEFRGSKSPTNVYVLKPIDYPDY